MLLFNKQALNGSLNSKIIPRAVYKFTRILNLGLLFLAYTCCIWGSLEAARAGTLSIGRSASEWQPSHSDGWLKCINMWINDFQCVSLSFIKMSKAVLNFRTFMSQSSIKWMKVKKEMCTKSVLNSHVLKDAPFPTPHLLHPYANWNWYSPSLREQTWRRGSYRACIFVSLGKIFCHWETEYAPMCVRSLGLLALYYGVLSVRGSSLI